MTEIRPAAPACPFLASHWNGQFLVVQCLKEREHWVGTLEEFRAGTATFAPGIYLCRDRDQSVARTCLVRRLEATGSGQAGRQWPPPYSHP